MNVVEQFRGEYSFLSNFHPCCIKLDGRVYPSAENAYQASKTTDTAAKKIMVKLSAGQAKRFGRTIRMSPVFNRRDSMFEILEIKFSDPELRTKLSATKGKDLVEGNYWNDKFWGVCLKTGKGNNVLGIMLMKIRDK